LIHTAGLKIKVTIKPKTAYSQLTKYRQSIYFSAHSFPIVIQLLRICNRLDSIHGAQIRVLYACKLARYVVKEKAIKGPAFKPWLKFKSSM